MLLDQHHPHLISDKLYCQDVYAFAIGYQMWFEDKICYNYYFDTRSCGETSLRPLAASAVKLDRLSLH